MKKIFTLLFFTGLLTSAFAQRDRHQEYGNPSNNHKYQSPEYSGNNDYGYSHSYPGRDKYDKDDHWNKRYNENDYGYDTRWDHHHREDMRRNQYSRPPYQKTIIVNQYPARRRAPLIKILVDLF